VSPGCEPLTGIGDRAVIRDAEAFFALIPQASRPQLAATLDASARQLSNWNWNGPLLPAHGSTEKWVTIRARPRRVDGGLEMWDGLVFDDTQNRLAQLEIERSREELRALSRHLQSVREEEKARIAREIHDELGSTLTALKMDLDWLGTRLPENTAAQEKHAAMEALVETAVAATRKIVTDLRPSILDDLGLAAALQWQAGEYRKHGGMSIEVDTPEPDLVIDRERALTLFRIFQEALTNVARHAQASDVEVALSEIDGRYVLRIRDDGVGVADHALDKPSSHGIRGMRERAQQWGGDICLESAPGDGTAVVVTIPKPAS
jgi:signal transduction histidine kinase